MATALQYTFDDSWFPHLWRHHRQQLRCFSVVRWTNTIERFLRKHGKRNTKHAMRREIGTFEIRFRFHSQFSNEQNAFHFMLIYLFNSTLRQKLTAHGNNNNEKYLKFCNPNFK